MKALFFTREFPPYVYGGAGVHVEYLAAELLAKNLEDHEKIELIGKFDNGFSGLKAIQELHPDLVFLDIDLPKLTGLELIELLDEAPMIIFTTAYNQYAIEAFEKNAVDYLLKPFDPEELGVLIAKIIAHRNQAKENLFLREDHKERTRFESMIGQSKPMQQIFDLIMDIKDTESTVLITGETGTGKELIAKAIHVKSSRNNLPFVPLNCGAFPDSLLESELFGYHKGAFTGASHTRKGFFEVVSGGTLFLDEVGELPLSIQKKFLRALQEKQ